MKWPCPFPHVSTNPLSFFQLSMAGLAKVAPLLITEACDCFIAVPTLTTTVSATETATEYLRQFLYVTTTTSTATTTTIVAVTTDIVGFTLVAAYPGSACFGTIVTSPNFALVNYVTYDLDPGDQAPALANCADYCLNQGQGN
jgi:hypothetical protein